ncbi:unnamed protein product [Allacma fusca]|uniref:Uncharacterized protein n=1 Tax=Allacma fusca TaxID=39272 RepID=A0A8J2LIQ7_9HEXA|nr:unnamed protein product [Allacma fusca]
MKLFEVERCKITKTGDEKKFIQVKIFENKYFIYCAGSQYTVGKKNINCPEEVFTLPLSATFTLNEIEYKGSILKIFWREKQDPLLTEQANWQLNPNMKWSNLTAEFDQEWTRNEKEIQTEVKNLRVFEFHDEQWTFTEICLSVSIILLVIAMLLCVMKSAFKIKIKSRKTEVKSVKMQEEIPLQEVVENNYFVNAD